jgi:4-hydroxy-3-polyprenylbenzoate decarboxylase
MSTRCDPETQIELLRGCVSSPLDTALPLGRESAVNSRMVIDACRPYARIKDYPPVVEMSPEMKAHVERRFADLLRDW